ncbi:unnamed protein product [Sphagnum jensenii]|uniref:Phytocyanin domain-containing protein n=1 Tax=Sphagnum jensenii TaxID=128206 RepID=A0ABP1B365_9BRYO
MNLLCCMIVDSRGCTVFSMPYGGHTIDQFFDANAFAACNFSAEHREWAGPNITMFDATLKNTGQYYFACAIPGHCLQGQKLSLFVHENIAAAAATATTTTTTTVPAPAPAPQARAPQQLTRMRFQQPTASPSVSPNSGPAPSPLARPPMPAVGYPIRSPVVAPAGSPKASRRLVRPPAYAPAAASRGRPIAHHAGRVLHLL